MSRVLKKRLEWVEHARRGLLLALGEDVMHHTVSVRTTADPLMVILKIPLLRPLAKGTRKPVRDYLRCWGDKYNCEMRVINIDNRKIQAEVLIKHRHWRVDDEEGTEEGDSGSG